MKKERLYIVRKYVVASSPADAIRKERHEPVLDVWLEENSQKDYVSATIESLRKKGNIGFQK